MPVHAKDSALDAALSLDFTAARHPRPDDLGRIVAACLAASPEPLTVCLVVRDVPGIAPGTYCLDAAGFLHQAHARPLAHLTADLAVLIGGPATAAPADLRALSVAAGVVSHHLAARLAQRFQHVLHDDDTVAWPLVTANGPITHLSTVTGKDPR